MTVLHKYLMEVKNDRYELLKSYNLKGVGKEKSEFIITDFGASFLNYDKENKISGVAHCLSFASCTEEMMADANVDKNAIKNKEAMLFKQWWQAEKDDNPILENLSLDKYLSDEEKENLIVRACSPATGGKQDTCGDIISALGEKATEGGNYLRAERNRKIAENKMADSREAMKLNQAELRHQALQHEAKGLNTSARVREYQRLLEIRYSTAQITQNITSYALTRSSDWRPSAWRGNADINRIFSNMLDMGSEKNAQELIRILTYQHNYYRGQYGETIRVTQLTSKQYINAFSEAANLTAQQKNAILHSHGGFTGSQNVLTITYVADTEIQSRMAEIDKLSREAQKNLEEAKLLNARADSANDAVFDIPINNRNPFITPILSGADISFSAIGLLLNVINFKGAIAAFSLDDKASISNLIGAFFGLAGAIHGSLMIAKKISGAEHFDRVVARNAVIKGITHNLAGKAFGFGAAIFDGITQIIKAQTQYKKGNKKAGDYYTASAAFLLVGGIALTVAATALAVIGAVFLLGIGTYLMFKADDATFTIINYWLDACIFGKNELPENSFYAKNKKGADNEYIDYIKIRHQPKIEIKWEGIDKKSIIISVTIPTQCEGKPQLTILSYNSFKGNEYKELPVSNENNGFNDPVSVEEKNKNIIGYLYKMKIEKIPRFVYGMTCHLSFVLIYSKVNEMVISKKIKFKYGISSGNAVITVDTKDKIKLSFK